MSGRKNGRRSRQPRKASHFFHAAIGQDQFEKMPRTWVSERIVPKKNLPDPSRERSGRFCIYSYNDYMTSDTSPTRWDIAGTFEANTRMTNKIWNKLGQIDVEKFETLITGGDFLDTWKYIESTFFAL